MADTEQWWFGFRQTHPRPPGRAIACGPYPTLAKAKVEREHAKAWDCEVSIYYSAATKEEAEQKARQFLET